jgi:hypothetical protein
MKKRKGDFEVAFDPITGSHQRTPKVVYEVGNPLNPNFVQRFRFESSLCYKRYDRSDKKIYFIFEDDDGREFSMFVKEFTNAIPFMVGGRLTGTFGFRKYGTATGLYFETTPPEKRR